MKELSTYNRAAGYLNRIFDLMNQEFFENTLSRPTLTIQSTPRAYGHFSLRDAIKQEMLNRDTEELSAGQYIVRWTSVLTNRFDSTAFKKVMPEVYKAYTKQVSSKRFSISA